MVHQRKTLRLLIAHRPLCFFNVILILETKTMLLFKRIWERKKD